MDKPRIIYNRENIANAIGEYFGEETSFSTGEIYSIMGRYDLSSPGVRKLPAILTDKGIRRAFPREAGISTGALEARLSGVPFYAGNGVYAFLKEIFKAAGIEMEEQNPTDLRKTLKDMLV